MTPDEQESRVRDAFAYLCSRAKVNPDATDDVSARLVGAVLVRDRMTTPFLDLHCPEQGPFTRWFIAATGIKKMLVTEGLVVLRLPRERGEFRSRQIPLPPVVRRAISLAAVAGIHGLIKEKEVA